MSHHVGSIPEAGLDRCRDADELTVTRARTERDGQGHRLDDRTLVAQLVGCRRSAGAAHERGHEGQLGRGIVGMDGARQQPVDGVVIGWKVGWEVVQHIPFIVARRHCVTTFSRGPAATGT